jgi:hypothetical protein
MEVAAINKPPWQTMSLTNTTLMREICKIKNLQRNKRRPPMQANLSWSKAQPPPLGTAHRFIFT